MIYIRVQSDNIAIVNNYPIEHGYIVLSTRTLKVTKEIVPAPEKSDRNVVTDRKTAHGNRVKLVPFFFSVPD